MNTFQLSFPDRLHSWRELRHTRNHLSSEEFIIDVDNWWQRAPLVKQHLHWNDQENWSDPWTLLSENQYCLLTRAIGMIYSLLLCGIDDIKLLMVTDANCEEHYLVTVCDAKYILNYWPNSVLSTTLAEFTVVRELPLDSIHNKIK
jgi:hypothetical protein